MISLDKRVVSFYRHSDKSSVLVLVNISKEKVDLVLPHEGCDLLSEKNVKKTMTLDPYDVCWIEK